MKRLYLAFFLSGFAALVYELTWSHYLRLLIGHAAYAQTLVVVLFMGGMALGAMIGGKLADHRPIRRYAIVEGMAAVWALLFHPLFVLMTDCIFHGTAPTGWVTPLAWGTAVMLVVPPSVLLGTTYPLLAAGITGRRPAEGGRILAALYAVNGLGGVVGVLAAGFVIIGTWGLPASLAIAAAANMAAAGLALRVGDEPTPAVPKSAVEIPLPSDTSLVRLLIVIAFATGAASFMYEMGWIRLLSFVLGSSVHSFDVMLSSFILGLALGGWFIRSRIDGLKNPVATLALVQVAMGSLAIMTLPVYGQTFRVMSWLRDTVPRTDAGYLLHHAASHGISLLVMFPASFCAGMTLPLIMRLLMGARGGRAIGHAYAANTAGGILGAVLAVQVGFESVGVKGTIVAGAGIDIVAGLLPLFAVGGIVVPATARVVAAAGGGAAFALGSFVFSIDPLKASSGVYRLGQMLTPGLDRVAYFADGKTATISVTSGVGRGMAFRTNGKADACVVMNEADGEPYDEVTMTLIAALPLATHPGAKKVANIGLGSGITTDSLLCNTSLERVDTIEIEPKMAAAARCFDYLAPRAFSDPRSRIHIEDARRFLASSPNRYDVIISEPSNPWVSGVSGLFSSEFYGIARRSLAPGGIFVQWLQLYEMKFDLIVSVLKALGEEFADYAVYAANDRDMVILATADRDVPPIQATSLFSHTDLWGRLTKVNIRNEQDVKNRLIANKRLLNNYVRAHPCRASTDYYPFLEQQAAKSQFVGDDAAHLEELSLLPLPFLEMMGGTPSYAEETAVTPSEIFPRGRMLLEAASLRKVFLGGNYGVVTGMSQEGLSAFTVLYEALFSTADRKGRHSLVEPMYHFFTRMGGYLNRDELETVWKRMEQAKCHEKLTPPEREWLLLYQAAGRRNGPDMARHAEKLLADLPPETSPLMRRYLLLAAMLGRRASGDHAGAVALWSRYGDRVLGTTSPSFFFALLMA